MINNLIKYTENCLTYMDIQGFSNMVIDLYPDDPRIIFEILKEFKNSQYTQPSDYHFTWQPDILSFSDSIIRGISQANASHSVKGMTVHEMIINEVKALQLIQQSLLIWRPASSNNDTFSNPGIFLRGGFSVGMLYFDQKEGFLFGPAMIQAYALENTTGKPFRIIIDPQITSTYPKTIAVLKDQGTLAQDDDGCWFIDYLTVNPFVSIYASYIELERLGKVRDVLNQQISLHADDVNLLNKYRWAANRHNRAVKACKPLTDVLMRENLELERFLVPVGA